MIPLNYFALEKELERITHLNNIISLAHWDLATSLPEGATINRQKEIATTSSLSHKMFTSKEIGNLIKKINEEIDFLNEWQLANFKQIKKTYERATCISPEIEHQHSIVSSECEYIWRSARVENNFKKLKPYLDKVFDSIKTISTLQAEKLWKDKYDILLDTYDPDRSTTEIKNTYSILKKELPVLIEQILEKQKSEKIIPLSEEIDENIQKAIGLEIIKNMGFDMKKGRLDKSVHPFCSGSNDDVRLTTRYNKNNFLSGLYGIIHETGHGLYQQNLPAEYHNQPVGNSKGMAFHESQSLIMEMQAGISLSFMEYLAKLLKDKFNFKGKEYSAENLYKLMTRVEPSFIRVDADEVTYPLHVILRFEIEQDIIEGNIGAADLPTIWSKKMQEYLGIIPNNDTNGCMQDIHWPSGSFGYFPSYTNGAIIASMLMKAAKEKYPQIDSQLKDGDFSTLNTYLTKNLRQLGSLKKSADLLENATGYKQIEPLIFIEYLKSKYLYV